MQCRPAVGRGDALRAEELERATVDDRDLLAARLRDHATSRWSCSSTRSGRSSQATWIVSSRNSRHVHVGIAQLVVGAEASDGGDPRVCGAEQGQALHLGDFPLRDVPVAGARSRDDHLGVMQAGREVHGLPSE